MRSLLYKQRMRRLVVLGLVLGIVLVAACADSGDDDPIPCGGGQGPLDVTFTSIDLVAQDLTCISRTTRVSCTGQCCIPRTTTSSMTVACTSPCLALDEAACASDEACYVARDFTAFYRGAPDSFVGCFPETTSSSSAGACAQRTADGCASDGLCAGLYDSSSQLVECIDEALLAGSCTGVATCTTSPPSCSADRTPGVAAGCYTGACIPTALCP